jgi:hypothetical protein
LLTEANELLAIFAASLWTARQKRKSQSVNVSMAQRSDDPILGRQFWNEEAA